MQFKTFINKIYGLLQGDQKLLRKMVVFAISLGILELTIPFGVQVIINRIYQTFLLDSILVILTVVLVFLVLQSIYLYLRFNLSEYIQRRVFSKVAVSLSNEVQKEKYTQIDGIKVFEAVNLKKTISKFITDGLSLILSFVFGTAIILFYHPFFAILTLITAFIYGIMIFIYHGRTSETSIQESKAKYKLANEVVNVSTEKKNFLKEVIDLNHNFLEKRFEHFQKLKSQYIFILIVYIFSQVALLGFGSYLILQGELSVGQLVASELIFSVILSALSKSITYIETYYDCYASIEKICFVEEILKVKDKRLRPKKTIFFYRLAIAFFVISPLLLLFIPWIQTSKATGNLTTLNPEERVQEISSFTDGRILKWYVNEGQEVREGDFLVELVDNDPNYAERLRTDRNAAFQKYQADKMAAETALINFKRQRKLFKEGLSSRVKFEKSKIEYHKLLAKEAQSASTLAKKEVNLSRQERRIVTAPSDGIIQQLYSGNTSSNIKKGTKLAVFVPKTNTPALELFVDGNDLPLIYESREVIIEFEGFPALQFSGWPSLGIGLFKGVVTSIDSTIYKNGKFRIMVTPKDISDWPNPKILRRGSLARGWIQLNEVTLGYELWRQFNGFPAMPDETSLKKAKDKLK